jgi:D-arabinose 1-dehydrogenase-like Zn-dependent alcohol dehydrogenase
LKRRRCCALEFATFDALRHAGAMPSDLIAVQGIGRRGHLGIQFANKFGYKEAAVGSKKIAAGSLPFYPPYRLPIAIYLSEKK